MSDERSGIHPSEQIPDARAPDAPRNEFHIEEYKSLRQEIILLKQQQFTIEKWVVVSLGLIYGLAFGVTNDSAQKILPTISKPVLFFGALAVAVVGAGFYSVNDYILLHISEYIKQIENRFAATGAPGGWEHFFGIDDKRHTWGIKKSPFWWAVLSLTTLLVALRLGFPNLFEAVRCVQGLE